VKNLKNSDGSPFTAKNCLTPILMFNFLAANGEPPPFPGFIPIDENVLKGYNRKSLP
jgi:hypothetical protein